MTITGLGKDGQTRVSNQLCYVAEGLHKLFLSQSVCKDLGIVDSNFPNIGSFDGKIQNRIDALENVETDTGENDDHKPKTGCQCPKRTLPPPPPPKIPLPPTEENIPKLKEWIVNYYSSSSFNCCSNQALPFVTNSPPMILHVDPKARPVAAHKPAPVPLHWQRAVKEGLDQDVELGVIEKVAVDEPTDWCSRMVVCAKKDGSPRRTVDLKNLIKFALGRRTQSKLLSTRQLLSLQILGAHALMHGMASIPSH